MTGDRTGKRRRNRGALLTAAAVTALAGILRLGTGVSTAIAAVPATTTPAVAAKPAKACPPGKGLAMPLVKALKEREDRVVAQEAALADRKQALALTEKIVDRKLAELRSAEEKLAKTLTMADTAAENDVDRLTKVYAAMKPARASAVFEKMAPEFAAGFLGRMAPEPAAAIMAGLTPEKAYAVSVILAGRNAAAPTK